jgi:hypothetical protein
VGVTTATIPLTTDGTKLYYTNSWGSALSALKIKSEVGSHVQADCNLGTVKIGTDKSLSLTGLTQGRDYTYYLVAENAGGYLSDVVRVDFTTLLPTPEATDFSVTGLEGGTEYSYTSEIQIVVQSAVGVTGVGGATLCYKKQNADGSYGALQTGQPQDVGTYKLYAKVVAGASYAAVDELDLNETVHHHQRNADCNNAAVECKQLFIRWGSKKAHSQSEQRPQRRGNVYHQILFRFEVYHRGFRAESGRYLLCGRHGDGGDKFQRGHDAACDRL